MRTVFCLSLALASLATGRAAATPSAVQIEAYFRPFSATNNLSGSVLIIRDSTKLFAKSYGFADQEKRVPNGANTRIRVASVSIPFTSTAVLRLIDQGKLSFETHVSEIVPGVPNGDKITIRNLLLQNSNLPDSNDDLPNYDDLLKSHQTPESLVAAVSQLPTHGEPGGKSQREEHSGQNLLALIIEKKTGLPFAKAMKQLVFDPFGMRDSGVDDDTPVKGPVARGYEVSGTFGLKPAPATHWSAKTGNGSAYSTPIDVWKWIQGVVRGPLLSASSRAAIMGTDNGFGWWQVASPRLGESVFQSNGRGPGFSSFFEYLPKENLAVIVLSNIEHDANPSIAVEAAAMVMDKTYQAFNYTPVPAELVGTPSGSFTFGPDFYRPSGTLKLVSDANGVTLYWPDHPVAPLLPIEKDKFMDRYYWTAVTLIRDANKTPTAMEYGRFKGLRSDRLRDP